VNKHEVGQGGTVGDAPVASFDAEALAADEACDGYYLIVTSKTDMGDLEAIDTYRGLWRIEESFRITKSDLAARPACLSRPDHIEAHFLVCFAALTIVRLMQLAVRERRSDGTAPRRPNAGRPLTGRSHEARVQLVGLRSPHGAYR
jgi:hypothetical protein